MLNTNTIKQSVKSRFLSGEKFFTLVIAIVAIALTSHAQNTWTQKVDFGGIARYGAVGFSIGSKGYLGTGLDINLNYYKDFWEYDPDADVWSQKADFDGMARYLAVGLSIGDKGYVGTGFGPFIASANDFWEYDPALNTWTQKADFGGSGRWGAAAFSIDQKGYIGTGRDIDFYTDFWEYNSSNDTWIQKADFPSEPRIWAAAFSIGGKGYIATGSLTSGGSADMWQYDPAIDSWTQKADYGGGLTFGNVGFSIGEKGYVGAGYDPDFWEYDSSTDTWEQKSDFGGGFRIWTVAFSIGNRGYIGTGFDFNTTYFNDFWEYTPDSSCLSLTFYADVDGDTYGNANDSTLACALPIGYVIDNTDCDDTNPEVNPAATEITNNNIDDDCDGDVDEFGVGISSVDVSESTLSVFPNPTDGTFITYLKLSDEVNAEATLEVLNLLGQKLLSEKVQVVKGVLQKEIQLSDAADGMYMVKVTVNDQVYSTQINYQK